MAADPHAAGRHPPPRRFLCDYLRMRTDFGHDVRDRAAALLVDEVVGHDLLGALLVDDPLPPVRRPPVFELVPLVVPAPATADLDLGVVGELELGGVGRHRRRGLCPLPRAHKGGHLAVEVVFAGRAVPAVLPRGPVRDGAPRVPAHDLGFAPKRRERVAHRALDPRPFGRGLRISSGRVTHLAAGISTISPQGKPPLLQVLHPQMKQLHPHLAVFFGVLDLDSEVHVAVRGRVVVADAQPLQRREELRKVLRRRRSRFYLVLGRQREVGERVVVFFGLFVQVACRHQRRVVSFSRRSTRVAGHGEIGIIRGRFGSGGPMLSK